MSTLPASFAASTTSLDNAMYGASLLHHPATASITSYPILQEASTQPLTSVEVDEGRYVHPTSMKLYQKCGRKLGFLRYFPIFGEAVECYGPKFIFTLDFTQFVSKGIAYTIIMTAIYPMFTEYYKATTLEYNRYYTVARMGWSIKPFTALISDSFAVFQYKKRWLLTISALFLGALCSFILAFLPHESSSAVAGSLLAFLVGLGQANIDILSEGLYARRIRERPSAGPNLVSTVWIVQMIASIIAAVTQGPLSDGGLAWVGMVICGVCMAICAPVLLVNWFEEKHNRLERIQDAAQRREQRKNEQRKKEVDEKACINDPFDVDTKDNGVDSFGDALQSTVAEEDPENVNLEEELVVLTYCGGVLEFNKEVIVRNWRISVFCAVMAAVVVATAIITALYEGWVLFGVAAGGAILLSVLFFWALPFTVSKAGFYAFLSQALYLNLASPLNGFYLANPACPSDYPQFSYAFYNSITGVIGGVAGLAGVVAFSYIFSKSTYRLSFVVTALLYVIGSVFDLIMVERWNLPAIPDQYFYVFGDAIVSQVAYMLNWMPMCILLAQLCPRGSEAMVYALLAAFANYGQTIAGEVSTILIEFVWPVSTANCDFGNLWKLIVLGHLGLPLLQIPLVFLLIPKARVCDQLNADGTAIKPDEKGNSK